VLLVVVAGTQLPDDLIVARLTPAPVLILILWVVGLALIGGPGKHLPWADSGEAPDSQQHPRGHSRTQTEKKATSRGVRTGRAVTVFGGAAVLTLIVGVPKNAAAKRSSGTSDSPERSSARRSSPPPPRCLNCPPG